MRRAVWIVVAAAVAVLASACQLRVATDVAVDADGTGSLTLAVVLDQELYTSLTADGFEPFAAFGDLPDGWDATVSEDGRRLDVTTDFARPADLAARVADLQAGLDQEDPLLLDGVTLTVDDDGAASFSGRAGLRPPSSTGAEGPGITFDGQDLARLLADRGDELVRYDLRVELPGPIVDTDADTVDGRVAEWQLPVTELRPVHATADAPAGGPTVWVLAAGVAVLAAVVTFGVTVWVRRSRRRRHNR